MRCIKKWIALLSTLAIVTGCQMAETPAQPTPERITQVSTISQTIVGKSRMASFSAPENCERMSMDTMRIGGAKRTQTGCVIRSGDTMVIVGLTELSMPFEQAFTVYGGGSGDFQQVAAAFPREMLSDYVIQSEETALASGEPGWRYSNKSSTLLPGNGGVDGASACARFSFDGESTSAPSRKSKVSGLRCARFGSAAETVQEVMLEVMAFYPANQRAPDIYKGIAEQATQSFRFR